VTVVLRLVNGFTVSLGGHYSTDYYDHSAPNCDIVTQPTYPRLGGSHIWFRRSSHSNLPADLGLLQILYTWINQARDLSARSTKSSQPLTTRNQNHKSRGSLRDCARIPLISHTTELP
jgi:hypothetical protein